MSPLLRKAQVAELLGVSLRTIDRLRASGQLPATRVRAAVRFRREDVLALVNVAKKGSRP